MPASNLETKASPHARHTPAARSPSVTTPKATTAHANGRPTVAALRTPSPEAEEDEAEEDEEDLGADEEDEEEGDEGEERHDPPRPRSSPLLPGSLCPSIRVFIVLTLSPLSLRPSLCDASRHRRRRPPSPKHTGVVRVWHQGDDLPAMEGIDSLKLTDKQRKDMFVHQVSPSALLGKRAPQNHTRAARVHG